MMTTTSSSAPQLMPPTSLDLILQQIAENNRQVIFGEKPSGIPETNGFKKNALANTENSDQTALWQLFIQAITGTLNDSDVQKNNVIAVGTGIPTNFDNLEAGVAVAQLYAIGNTIPPWSLKWNGATNDNLFGTYQQFVDLIHPNALDPDSDEGKATWAKMQEIVDKTRDIKKNISDEKRNLYSAYLDEVCLQRQQDNKGNPLNKCQDNCYVPSEDYPDGDQPEYDFTTWKEQNPDSLLTDYNNSLLGLESDYTKLAQEYYGAGYQAITNAQNCLNAIDPNGPTPPSSENANVMAIKAGNKVAYVPRFVPTTDLELVRDWVAQQKDIVAKNGGILTEDKALVKVYFDNTSINQTQSNWQFHTTLGVPIDWFWLGEDASGSQQNQFEEKYGFKGIISYQSVTKVMFQPGEWFNQSLLNTYANFDLSKLQSGDPFYGQQLWGPTGIFNILVKGVIIGFGGYMRFEMDDWQNSTTKTQWSTKTTFGIGPFNFESADASGSSYSSQTNEIQNGLEVIDTSGQPKIIALIVETPNYSPVS